MSKALVVDPLKRALSQSEALLALAQADDWESFESLIQTRQQGLMVLQTEDYMNNVAAFDASEEVAELIRAIQAINQQLEVLSEKRQTILMSEIRQSLRGSKAMNAYGQ